MGRVLCSGSVMRENKNAEVRPKKYLDCDERPQVPFLRNAWLTVIGLNQLFWWSRRGLRRTSCGFRQAHPDDTVYSSSQKAASASALLGLTFFQWRVVWPLGVLTGQLAIICHTRCVKLECMLAWRFGASKSWLEKSLSWRPFELIWSNSCTQF